MPALTDVTGLGGAAVAVAWILLSLPGFARLRKARPLLLSFLGVLVALWPLGTLPAAGYVRGIVGDLSVPTVLLLLRDLLRPIRGWDALDRRGLLALQLLVAAGGLVLYPAALGLVAPDPYRLGYSSPGFVAALFLVALAAWLLGLHLVAVCVASAVLAWAVGACESRNLWDYLIDPLLSAYAAGALLVRSGRWLLVSRPPSWLQGGS